MSSSLSFLAQELTPQSNKTLPQRKAPLAPHLQSNEMDPSSPPFSTSSSLINSSSSSTNKTKKSSKKSRSSSSKLLKTTVLTFVNDKKQPTMNSIDERYIYVGSDLNSIESAQSSASSSTSSSSSISYLSSLQCSNHIKSPINTDIQEAQCLPISDHFNDGSNKQHDEQIICNHSHYDEERTNLEIPDREEALLHNNTDPVKMDDLNQSISSTNSSKNVPKPQPRSIYLNYDERTTEENQEQNSNNEVSSKYLCY